MILLLIIAIILGNPISIILILFAMHEDAAAADWEYSERQKERRHEELMDIQRKRLEVAKRNRSEVAKRTVRTMARDERGRFIAQEVIEEYDDDYGDEDDYDDFE